MKESTVGRNLFLLMILLVAGFAGLYYFDVEVGHYIGRAVKALVKMIIG
ncbi:MAG: hypothetical protein AABZ60_09095 [Planctomycetota bacterium]